MGQNYEEHHEKALGDARKSGAEGESLNFGKEITSFILYDSFIWKHTPMLIPKGNNIAFGTI